MSDEIRSGTYSALDEVYTVGKDTVYIHALKSKQWGHFFTIFSTYRWQHDVVRSNHVTIPRDHNILLLSTILLFIYNHTKEIEFYLFADWLQDLWGRLQFDF